MFRALSLSLSKSTYLISSPTKSTSPTRLFPLRSLSTNPSSNPDLDDTSSPDPLLRKLEDAIHRIIVRRSAPDWLPFLPGSSYWVPPPRSTASSLGLAQLVEKLASPLPDQQPLSPTSARGWPSPDYFINGAHLQQVEVKVSIFNVEEETASSNASKSEDEEG